MAFGSQAGGDSNTEQRTVKRSFLFVYLPIVILVVLGINLIWEEIRANVGPGSHSGWPLRFALLDLSTTAQLIGVTAGLLFARLQWGHANRPTISFAIDDENAEFLAGSKKWRVWFHNGGPGSAVVEEYQYVVKFTSELTSAPTTLDHINDAMEARGLVDGEDYFVREQGKGAAYPATPSYIEGSKIGWFTAKALAEIEVLNIVVRVKDSLGDTHERVLVVAEKMPSVAKKARAEAIALKRSTVNP